MQNMCRTLIRGGEEVAIDGFASFDVSQYYPNNITLSVTGESLFVLEASHATMRRSGRMNERQKARREEQEKRVKGERGGVSRSFREVLDQLAEGYPRKWGEPLVIWTDRRWSTGGCSGSTICIGTRTRRGDAYMGGSVRGRRGRG
jgi:hypothetical protein